MFRSMISSRRITAFVPSLEEGIGTIRDNTLGTCTIANSSCFLLLFLSSFFGERSAPIFRDLLRIKGKGLEESTAMGVSTGYTFSSK